MIYWDKSGVMVRDAEIGDIDQMKNRLRKQEVDEVWAAAHSTPEEILHYSFKVSVCPLSFFFNGEIAAMTGIVPDGILSPRAQVWLLTTDTIERMKIRWLKFSRQFISFYRYQYPELWNFVDARNTQCVRWLRWCGARVDDASPYGTDQLPFHYFAFDEGDH